VAIQRSFSWPWRYVGGEAVRGWRWIAASALPPRNDGVRTCRVPRGACVARGARQLSPSGTLSLEGWPQAFWPLPISANTGLRSGLAFRLVDGLIKNARLAVVERPFAGLCGRPSTRPDFHRLQPPSTPGFGESPRLLPSLASGGPRSEKSVSHRRYQMNWQDSSGQEASCHRPGRFDANAIDCRRRYRYFRCGYDGGDDRCIACDTNGKKRSCQTIGLAGMTRSRRGNKHGRHGEGPTADCRGARKENGPPGPTGSGGQVLSFAQGTGKDLTPRTRRWSAAWSRRRCSPRASSRRCMRWSESGSCGGSWPAHRH